MRKARITRVLRSLEREVRGGQKGNALATTVKAASKYSYRFGSDWHYRIAVANDLATRRKAWSAVYDSYREIRYLEHHPSELRVVLQDASPATTSFLVEENSTGEVQATFTLTPDNPLGLPLETYYAAEVEALRAKGRKPCEISKLVAFSLCKGKKSEEKKPGLEVLLNVFRLAYLTARRLEACTDFVIAVVPRHVRFYQRLMLFEPLGEARSYESLNGLETVLLRLDLLKGEERFRAKFGGLAGSKNLYNFFINDDEPVILEWLRRERRPMSAREFQHFFMEQTNIYNEATPEQRLILQDYYLAYDLESAIASAECARERVCDALLYSGGGKGAPLPAQPVIASTQTLMASNRLRA